MVMVNSKKSNSKIPPLSKSPPDFPKLPPNFTAMMIINELSKLFNDSISHAVENLGVKSGYRNILFFLPLNDGCSLRELAEKTHLKAPTISVTLVKMEQDGFIRREINSDDLRGIKIFLTEKGWEYHKLVRSAIDTFEKNLMSGVTDSENLVLKQTLFKIRNNLISEKSIDSEDLKK